MALARQLTIFATLTLLLPGLTRAQTPNGTITGRARMSRIVGRTDRPDRRRDSFHRLPHSWNRNFAHGELAPTSGSRHR